MTVVRRFLAYLPHQVATRHLGGTVSVAERRDLTEPDRFFVVTYRDRAGQWQSGKVEGINEANAAGIVLAEFLGCNFADVRE